jgi:thiol-disulfide isomerase/thioredoxin
MRIPYVSSVQALLASGAITWIVTGPAGAADEKFETLAVGSTTYTNVLVMSKNATDIFIKHSGGMASIKIKELSPELQSTFGFDAAKAEAAVKQRQEANVAYAAALKDAERARAAQPKAAAPAKAPQKTEPVAAVDKQAPSLVVESWVSSQPSTAGKFVLIDFWATWCGPCRQSIPHINQLHRKFSDRMVVIGLSNETPGEVRAMKSPKMEYFSAVDTQARTARAFNVQSIPYVALIDPNGIVRWQGHPGSGLTEKTVEDLLKKYAK